MIKYFIVDAFTSIPLKGNPAAIVLLDQWKSDSWLQDIALEMNLSETAFLVPNANGYDLRWFTPKAEVDLCGHATIASAVVLTYLEELKNGTEVAFSTKSGILKVWREDSNFQLDFPSLAVEPFELPCEVLESLKTDVCYSGRTTFDFLVEIESETILRNLTPDFGRLATAKCRGLIVTAKSDDPQFDFVSRFFAPAVGINEDPVTGSAHCSLAPYWAKKLGKTKLVGYQASARGGVVSIELRDDRVIIGGEGIIFATGGIAISDKYNSEI